VLDHRELSGAGDLFENMTNTHRRIKSTTESRKQFWR
jgi:hypothetical protein